MAAIFLNGYQNDHQNPEAGIFPFFPMYLDMQHIKFYFFDIIKFKFCTKNFKMAAVFKMAAKMHKFLVFQSILPCSSKNSKWPKWLPKSIKLHK